MNTKKSIATLQEQISAVQQALQKLGPMHPGSVSMQYQVCGRAGCRCMDPQHPRRHGPYHKLSYVYGGKSVCRFVRADCADEIKQRLATYKTFRKLTDRWIELSIQLAQIEFFGPPNRPKNNRTTAARARKSPRKTHQS